MIQIAIDEKACVSCTLCEEVCPTDVFRFDHDRGVPEVVRPAECFGCLSCSEICPSRCISHDGVERSEAHYHDPYALHLAARLGTAESTVYSIPDDEVSRAKALEDLGVRLRSVAEVFRRTLGGSLPAVGTMAGRTLARHLPRYREPKGLEDALSLAMTQFAPSWGLSPTLEGDDLTISIGRCAVRDVCRREGLELGEEMCVLFYNYLAGYVGRMGKVRLKLADAERGWEGCTYRVKVFEGAK